MVDKQLANLVRMDLPDAVLQEVVTILHLISHEFSVEPIESALQDTVRLYEGRYSGYRACTTEYHDLRHATTCFLALARLAHGAVLEGNRILPRDIAVGLIAALFHDVGYIQGEAEPEGRAALHAVDHVNRSMAFLEEHGKDYHLTAAEITSAQSMVLCTDLTADISQITFSSPSVALLGKMLGTADLLGQMADRTYLEKLLFLYHEFREARIGNYESEMDLLRKTVGFYESMCHRLGTALDNSDRFMKSHFASRWGIDEDLYRLAMERHKKYLRRIFTLSDPELRRYLRREGIVERVREKYGDR